MSDKFRHKPGNGSLFKVTEKEAEHHADYTGTYVDHEDREHFLDGWIKEGKKGKFLSIRTTPKRGQ